MTVLQEQRRLRLMVLEIYTNNAKLQSILSGLIMTQTKGDFTLLTQSQSYPIKMMARIDAHMREF